MNKKWDLEPDTIVLMTHVKIASCHLDNNKDYIFRDFQRAKCFHLVKEKLSDYILLRNLCYIEEFKYD